VAGRVTLRGTPTTDLVTVMHIPATGKQVTTTGIVIARIANDKISERCTKKCLKQIVFLAYLR
jgi:predicted ester cyclase